MLHLVLFENFIEEIDILAKHKNDVNRIYLSYGNKSTSINKFKLYKYLKNLGKESNIKELENSPTFINIRLPYAYVHKIFNL